MSSYFVIIKKSLYERKLSTVLWFLVIVAFVLLTVMLFPVMRDSLGESLKDAPKSMEKFLGNAQDYQTLLGYVDLQVINQMVFMTVIMGVLVGTALIAGEERNGVLHTQLARPITRATIYWQKAAALALMTLVVAGCGIFFGVLIGALLLGESIDITRLFQASFMTWLLTYFFAVLAFALGAATGRRAVAGVIAGLYAFIAYMLTALSQLADSLEKLNYASIFRYFNTPSVLNTGLNIENILVLCGVSIILLAGGYLIFRSRDLNNR